MLIPEISFLSYFHGYFKEYFFRDSYAFCTEPVFASLANALGRLDNITPHPAHLDGFELLDIEVRYGLFQVK